MDLNKYNDITNKNKEEINNFTNKIDEMLSGEEKHNIQEEEDRKTPDEYWKGRYCALANSICRGPGCMQWDFTAPNILMDTYGDCAITGLNINLQYLCAGIKEFINKGSNK